MKAVKLTKKMLSMWPDELLVKLGATYERIGYPQHVYLSKEDYKKLKKNTNNKYEDEAYLLGVNRIEYWTGMEMLNYGPNQGLEDAIRPGYALVDDDAINIEIVKKKLGS